MRLFLAINLPDDVRSALWQAAESLRQVKSPVRWVAAESVHLTVKFLGDVDEARAGAVAERLTAATRPVRAFGLPLGGFGAFPTPTKPNVVWAGCEPVPPLELLQHDVERAMQDLGFAVEGRPFRPHVTLGRSRAGARPAEFAALKRALGTAEFAALTHVASVDVMESHLSRHGSSYVLRHSAPLAG